MPPKKKNIIKKNIGLDKINDNLLQAMMQEVEGKIAVIRNQEVIADADVAALYGVETKRVNEAVRNNLEKFPAHYMFMLNTNELQDLRSKISSTTDAKPNAIKFA